MALKDFTLTQKYLKELLHYDPETGIFTRLTKPANRVNIGDIAGSLRPDGYLEIGVKGSRYLSHRLAFLYMTGEFPDKGIDHVNHQRGDNRWNNIRCATQQKNMRNASKSKANTSGVTGVYWRKDRNRWRAMIKVDNKQIYLGMFIDLEDAANARKLANKKYGFHENHGMNYEG